jgi:hypothetical protein
MAKDDDSQDFPEDSGEQKEPSSDQSSQYKWANVAQKNWKAWLAFSKIAPMPAKGWKKDFALWKTTAMPEKPKAEKKAPKPLKRTPLPPPTKPIAKIGKRKKERILEEWSEVEMNREIWETRVNEKGERICVECGKKIKQAFIGEKLIKPQVFSHKLPKGMFPRYRLLPENIDMVCDYACHDKNAAKYSDLEVRKNMSEEFDKILKQRTGK